MVLRFERPTQLTVQVRYKQRDRLEELHPLTPIELRDTRIKKYRDMGFFQRFNYDNLGGVKR